MNAIATKITIIIPHYNTPELLIRLLNSIGWKPDIEVIVVDDASTNIESTKLQFSDNPNIEFLDNNTGIKGAGKCRNIGLSHAHGEWILFADADDFFTNDAWDIINSFVDSDYEMIYFSPVSRDEETGNASNRHIYYKELIEKYLSDPCPRNLNALKYGFCTPWSKLIKKSLFDTNNIWFDEIEVSNDVMCITKAAYYCKSFYVTNDIIYCVTRSRNSLTVKKDIKRFDIRVSVDIKKYLFLKERITKQELSRLHIGRNTADKLWVCIAEGYGIRKFIKLLILYCQNRVPVFSLELLNPIILLPIAYRKIKWWKEIGKHR